MEVEHATYNFLSDRINKGFDLKIKFNPMKMK
jgi:hypothetical protein